MSESVYQYFYLLLLQRRAGRASDFRARLIAYNVLINFQIITHVRARLFFTGS